MVRFKCFGGYGGLLAFQPFLQLSGGYGIQVQKNDNFEVDDYPDAGIYV